MGNNRVLIINLARQLGGAEIVCKELIDNFKINNIKYKLVLLDGSKFHNFIKDITEEDNLIKLPFNKKKILTYFKIILSESKGNFDIIHCHGIIGSIIGSYVARRYGIKIITTIHGIAYIDRNETFRGLIFKKLESYLIRFNDYYVCVSNFLRNTLIQQVGKKYANKVITIYNSVPKKEINRVELTNDTINICCVGRLELVKGQLDLVKAINILNRQDYKVNLYLIGDGSYKSQLLNYVNSNDINNIKFLGFIKNPLDYVDACDIFVSCSKMETFGLSIIEAMSRKKAIIATNVGAVSEFIIDKHNGILVNYNDCKVLSENIKKLIEDDEFRNKLGINALNFYRENFLYYNMAKEYIQLYDTLLKER